MSDRCRGSAPTHSRRGTWPATVHNIQHQICCSRAHRTNIQTEKKTLYSIHREAHTLTHFYPSSYPSHDYTLMGIYLYLIPYVIVLLFFRKVLESQMISGARPLSILQNVLLFPRMHSFTIHQHLYMGFLKVPESLLMGKGC